MNPTSLKEAETSTVPSEFDRLIRPIEQQMMGVVWRVTQNADDAEDAFQEAMTQIWQATPRIRGHANPHALILKICANVACDVLRRRQRHRASPLPTDPEFVEMIKPDVAATIEMQELREQIQAAIAMLSQQQATAITMRFLLAAGYEDIAVAMDCAETTVRVHVMRGLTRLRELLVGLNPSPATEKSHDT